MEWLKSLWSRWKVQVSVVGGVLVVATAYGTCSVDPATVSENTATETATTTETVEVSATTEAAGENTTGTTATTATTGTEADTTTDTTPTE